MARKRKQSGTEELMELVAMLPWWGGVALALVFYGVLHRLAVVQTPVAFQPGQMADLVRHTLLTTLAFYGQFIVPIICLVGALASFFKRRKRATLVRDVTNSKSADALNGMSWREFEVLVGEAYRLRGYKVSEQGGAQADGGVDLMLRKDGETFVVQCKQWKAFKVGVEVVRALFGVMAANGAAGGFVVTSGTFTEGAGAFAHGRNITLVDGQQLFDMIRQAKRSLEESAPSTLPAGASGEPETLGAGVPQCPICNASMVRRTAHKGSKAGAQFWGCSRFPSCRGTR